MILGSMENFIRQNRGILIVAFLFMSFSWLLVRPAIIRHECSWIKRHYNAVSGRAGLTPEEQTKALANCEADRQSESLTQNPPRPLNFYTCKERVAIDAVPIVPKSAEDRWEKSSSDEYKFCLQDRGL